MSTRQERRTARQIALLHTRIEALERIGDCRLSTKELQIARPGGLAGLSMLHMGPSLWHGRFLC